MDIYTGRRLVRVAISPIGLQGLLTPGLVFGVEEGIPEESQFRGLAIDHTTNTINTVFEHESFEICPEGGEIPFKHVYFKIYSGKTVEVIQRLHELGSIK